MPKVSVVIPSYNYARYVMEAVDSVLAQTYRDFEVIVVDDGSKDNTGDVLRDYAETGKIRYIYKDNAGLPAARNTGIDASEGEYVAMLDADDLWKPEKLERQMAYIAEHPEVDLLFCDELRFRDGEKPYETPRKILPGEDIFGKFLTSCYTTPSSLVFRKKAFDITGMFDESYQHCEDWDMMIRASRLLKVAYLPEYLVMRRMHKGSLSMTVRNKAHYYKMLYEKNSGPLTAGQRRLFRKSVAKRCYIYATRFIEIGFYGEALRTFAFASRFYPPLALRVFSMLKLVISGRSAAAGSAG